MNIEQNKPILVFQSPILTRSGYGDRARDLAYALLKTYKEDYNILFVPTRWGETSWDAITKESDPEIFSRITYELQPFQQWPIQPDVFIQHTVPNEFRPYGKVNIGITAGIETDTCSPEFVMGCNQMDVTLVSSQHAKEVLSKPNQLPNGQMVFLEKPVEVLFEGIDTSVFNKKLASSTSTFSKKLTNLVQEDFSFLFVGHWLKGDLGQDRKDVGMLVRCYGAAFKKEKNPPALILKTSSATFSHLDQERLEDRIKRIKAFEGIEHLPIYLIHGNLDKSEMNDLYNHKKVKVHISFFKGEGFGRPLLEATTSGKPVIATDYSGPKDFLHPEYSFKLPYELTQVHPSASDDQFLLQNAKWATVKYNEAISLMLTIFKNYKVFADKARKHSAYTNGTFSVEKMCNKLETLLEPHIQKVPVLKPLNLPKLKPIK